MLMVPIKSKPSRHIYGKRVLMANFQNSLAAMLVTARSCLNPEAAWPVSRLEKAIAKLEESLRQTYRRWEKRQTSITSCAGFTTHANGGLPTVPRKSET